MNPQSTWTAADDRETLSRLRTVLEADASVGSTMGIDGDTAVTGPQAPTLTEGLADGLAVRAAAEGLLDIAVRTVDSPVGPLLVAVTPRGVLRVAFEREDHDAVLDELAMRVSPRILTTPRRTDAIARELDDYFAGRRRLFTAQVDLSLIDGFRRRVVEGLGRIPYGATRTYGMVAAMLDNPKAVRAVGSACAHNPVPIVLPCHRVVRSDGTIGDYLGGTAVKRALLELESSP